MEELISKGADFLLAAGNLLLALADVGRTWLPWICWCGFSLFCIDWHSAYRLLSRQTALPLLLLFGLICTVTTFLQSTSGVVPTTPVAGGWQLSPWTMSIIQVSLAAGLAMFMGTIQLLVAPPGTAGQPMSDQRNL